MPSILLSPPALEPLTLDEAKAYLRVEHSDEDETVAALLTAARLMSSLMDPQCRVRAARCAAARP